MPQQQQIELAIKPSPGKGVTGVAVIVAGVLALFLDAATPNLINTGLPFLQGRVSATPDEGSWLLTTFNALYYVSIGLSPWLFVSVGRKRLLLISLSGFALTSLVLFSVTSFDVMLVLRAAQGVFAGAIFVPAATLMFLSLPPKLSPYGIPAFALISLTGASTGALLGGFFAETYGAGSVFIPGAFATIAVGILVAFAAPGDDTLERTPFDGFGVALSIFMFTTMQFLANEGERRDWFNDGSVIFATAVFALATLSLIVWEWNGARHPHLNMHLFEHFANLRIGALVNLIVGFLGYSITVFVVFLQDILGTSATTSGEMIMLRVATYFIGIPFAYVLILKKVLDLRVALVIGAVGTALSFVSFSHLITSTSALASFVVVSLIFGLFFGALNLPTPILVLSGLPPTSLISALPIYKLSAPFGTMLSFAVCETFLDHRAALVQVREAAEATLQNPSIALFIARGGTPAALAALDASQAAVVSQAALVFMLALLTVLLIPITLFIQASPKSPASPPQSGSNT